MKSKTSLPASYRLAVTSRVLAAVVGGYLIASLASICLALGVGLFGARLSALMERPADHARQTALHLLQTATSKAWAGEGC